MFCNRCHRVTRYLSMPSAEELLSVADLFSLTHGSVASSSTSTASPSAVPEAASLSEDTATLLSHVLVTAHAARRTGNHEASYESYQQLAEHFTSNNQLSNAMFFYERCLQVSKEHDWIEGQTAAHTNLGVYPLQPSNHKTLQKYLKNQHPHPFKPCSQTARVSACGTSSWPG